VEPGPADDRRRARECSTSEGAKTRESKPPSLMLLLLR
jgi:hypothetical protein